MNIALAETPLPEFGAPSEQPVVPAATYARRLALLIDRLAASGLAAALVYGDREHAANLAYLTGFDPRFEEALLLVLPGRDPVLLVGPEGRGYAAVAQAPLEILVYPPFGLLGQDRASTPPLADLLRGRGIGAGMAVGVIGWKYFGAAESPEPESWIEAPAYIVDAVRALAGQAGRVVNATALLMHPTGGMRAVNEIDQLAAFEFAACHTSDAVRRVLAGVRPGMREFEAARLLAPIGLPLNCHAMLSSGPRTALGLASPSAKVVERGEPFVTAYGVWGALNCRAGFLVEDAGELPEAIRDYLDRLVIPYFAAVVEWYETLGIGVTGGDLAAIVRRRLGDPFFGVFLNPGHLIHLDEWMHTPIYAGSTERLVSGQALQVDIIPATGSAYFTTNIEDGIALLDERGRAEFAERYPEAWDRIERRRAFMADSVGIRLKPEVLPFSNMPAHLPPFILAPDRAMAVRR